MTNLSLIRSLAVGLGVAVAAHGLALADEPPASGAPVQPTTPPATPPPTDATKAPEPAPAPEAKPEPKKAEHPAVEVSYDKGLKFESTDKQFEMKLALRQQYRFTFDRHITDGAEATTSFTIPRFRLQMEGHVFGADHRYKLEAALGDKQSFSFVKDMWIEQAFSGGKVVLRIGQYKQPFNRAEVVSDFGSVFNERANTAEFVLGGRDVGLMLHNDFEKSPEGLEWAFGVFQSFKAGTDKPAVNNKCTSTTDPMTGAVTTTCAGSGGSTAAADWEPAIVVRLGWNHGHIKGYSEGDLEGGPLRYAIGASYKIDLGDFASADKLQHGVGVDFMVKVEGFDATGGFYMMKGVKGVDARVGFTAQLGYFLTPKHLQLAGRFSMAPDADVTTSKENVLEMRGALNYYWQGHSWKWATDFGALKSTVSGAKADVQVRSMAQLTF